MIFPSCLNHGKLVKSSPSSHKLAGRFISRLTFSLEMPPGTWASALWMEMTGLLLGALVVKSYSLALSPLSTLSLSLFYSVSFSLWSLFYKRWQPLKRPRLTSVYFTLLISASFCFIIFEILRDNLPKSLVSGKNVHYDSSKEWHSLGFGKNNIPNSNYLSSIYWHPSFYGLKKGKVIHGWNMIRETWMFNNHPFIAAV